MIKKILLFLFLFILGYLVYHYKAVEYGIEQGVGQAKLLWAAQDITDLEKKGNLADSLKLKFDYIQAVKQFGQDSLGLEKTKNYTTYYDQKGKAILWVVTASPEFEIEAYEWQFPIAGKFSYKGFFDKNKAKNDAKKLAEKGYDTRIGEVNAWSTLGWFRDPILSSMLQRSDGKLAELILHELTHATVYKRNAVEFNENFATFVGQKGAVAFLNFHYGKNSKELEDYLKSNARSTIFKELMQNTTQQLKNLYSSFSPNMSLVEKRNQKAAVINELKHTLANSSEYSNPKAKERLANFQPNNAYFSGFKTYYSKQHNFEKQLMQEFHGNLTAFIALIKAEK